MVPSFRSVASIRSRADFEQANLPLNRTQPSAILVAHLCPKDLVRLLQSLAFRLGHREPEADEAQHEERNENNLQVPLPDSWRDKGYDKIIYAAGTCDDGRALSVSAHMEDLRNECPRDQVP